MLFARPSILGFRTASEGHFISAKRLTGGVVVEDETANEPNEYGHEGAAGHVGWVSGVGLQRPLLKHAVLVPYIRWV